MTKLIIDASNLRAGGGVTHLFEILNHSENVPFDIVEVFSGNKTLNKIDDKEWLIKSTHTFLNKGLFFIIIWKLFILKKILTNNKGKALLFVPAGTYIGSFRPFVSMSRNMLIFDSVESDRFGLSLMKLKFTILRFIQKSCFEKSTSIIFLSNYAKSTIQNYLSRNIHSMPIIRHGINKKFKCTPVVDNTVVFNESRPFELLYISGILPYKHQIPLIKAVKKIYNEGKHIKLTLVGGHDNTYFELFKKELNSDSLTYSKCVNYIGLMDYNQIQKIYKFSDGFIFSSSCENMPNILIEAMSSGLPILCSDFEPMPEFLNSNYPFLFDPTDEVSVYDMLNTFLIDKELRNKTRFYTFEESEKYSWVKCANETFSHLNYVYNNTII